MEDFDPFRPTQAELERAEIELLARDIAEYYRRLSRETERAQAQEMLQRMREGAGWR